MKTNDIVVYDVPNVIAEAKRNNYEITIGNSTFTLKRDVDFGKVPKAKSPSLWKAGAEKVLAGFGLCYDVEITDSYKDYKSGFFYYECKATAYSNGQVVRVGVGCANTGESSTGMASGFNTANATLKKAKKRAVVDLALTLGSLSDCFTQDMDDENFVNDNSVKKMQGDNDTITTKQIQRIFAIAGANEISREKAKELLLSWGYASTKDILFKDYDEVCKRFENYNK